MSRYADPFPEIPADLKAIPNWVLWRVESRPAKDGKPQKSTKVPYNARTGGGAVSTAPSTWAPYNVALDAFTSQRIESSGVGFVFCEAAGIVGVDLDGVRDPSTGVLSPWAADVVSVLSSYTEISPSGKGVHVLVRAKASTMEGNRKGPVEIYWRERYFTMSGQPIGDSRTIESRQGELEAVHSLWVARQPVVTPAPRPQSPRPSASLSDRDLIDRARRAGKGQGERFAMLYAGDWKGAGFPSQSEADQSFLNSLAFWTGRNQAQMDAIMRQSGLYREKWERPSYREKTIQRAIENCGQTYGQNRGLTA